MADTTVRVSLLMVALLDGARSRRDAVRLVQRMYRWGDGSEIDTAAAVEFVEAYYAQHGGKPWLRKKVHDVSPGAFMEVALDTPGGGEHR